MKCLIRRALAAFLLSSFCVLPAKANLIFTTAEGAPLDTGVELHDDSYVGHVFELEHLSSRFDFGVGLGFDLLTDTRIFAALVRLDSFWDLPDTLDLSSADVVSTSLFFLQAGYGISDFTTRFEDPISAGIYALVIGTGRFGADSVSDPFSLWMPEFSHDAAPWDTPFSTRDGEWISQEASLRFFAVPTPATALLLLIALPFLRRRTRA